MVSTRRQLDLPKNAAQGKRFSLVVSRYHQDISEGLLDGAKSTLLGLGAKESDLSVVWVPGSFEIPLAARTVAMHQDVDAIICLGVIIKGETPHNAYIATEVAHGIAQISQVSGIPVIFGVLTPENLEQAKARSGGAKGHKGVEAAETAVSMIQVVEQIKSHGSKSSKSVGF